MLTPAEKTEIRDLVAAAVADALQTSNCACNLSPRAQSELSHFMGMVKDLGDESYSKGIEVLRANNRYFFAVRKNVNFLSRTIAWALVTSGAGTFLYVVGLGIKVAIKAIKGP